MDNMDETIYNLLNRLPKYSSCHQSTDSKHYYRSNFTSNQNKNKYSHRTMGPAIVSKPDPSHPLRRRENYIELPQITPFIRSHRMPPIPKCIKENATKIEPSKNFIQENIIKMKNSLPINPRQYIVSDRKGNKYLINGSGLKKDFIYKKNYGKIPLYLQTRKLSNKPLNCNLKNNSLIKLSTEERLDLLNNLKIRYKDIMTEYQHLPLRLETRSNIMKEKSLTNELINIEHDINFLENHFEIFVKNN